METRANSLIVGIFALVALAAAAAFTWWQSSGTGGETREVLFVFPGSVAGLTAGSPVLFNGIKVGDVVSLSLDPQDLTVVNVVARVRETAPLKTDTRATLEFQGLTGYASIGLSGGSFTADSLFAEEGRPRVLGSQSSLTRLLADGQTIAERATSILNQVDTLVGTNAPQINTAVSNTATISENLADASQNVAAVLAAAGDVATSFQGLSAQVGSLAAQVGETVGKIDVAEINTTIANVRSVTGALAANEDGLTQLVTNAETASGQLTALLTQAGAFAAEARQAVGATRGVIATLGRVSGAVEPERVASILANIDVATGIVSENGEDISRLTRNAGEASERLNAILGDASGVGAQVSALAGAVDPETVGQSVANVQALTETLAASAEGVSRTVSSVEAAAASAATALEGTEGLGTRINDIVAGVEPTAVSETLTAARDVATGLQASVANLDPEALGAAVANTQALTETLAASAGDVSDIVTSARGAVDRAAAALEGTETLGADVNRLIASANDTASQVNAAVTGVTPESLSRASENVAAASETLAQLLTEAQGLPASVDATLSTARGAIRDVRGVIEAVDPEQVRGVVADVGSFADTLSERSPDIDATVRNLRTASEQANAVLSDASEFSSSFEGVSLSAERLVNRLDVLLADIEPAALSATVNNVRDFTTTLAANRGDVGQALRDLSGLAARLQESATRLDGVLVSVQGLVDDEAQEFFVEASTTATNLRTLSAELNARVPQIASNIDQFTGRGLEGLSSLIQQGQRTVGSLDRVIGTVEADPQQFLFGRGTNSDYAPRGRQ